MLLSDLQKNGYIKFRGFDNNTYTGVILGWTATSVYIMYVFEGKTEKHWVSMHSILDYIGQT